MKSRRDRSAVNSQADVRDALGMGSRSACKPIWKFVLLAASLGATFVSGQSARRDAHPGFDGIWNSATTTPLERPRQLKDKPFFTREEAAEWDRQFARNNEEPS